LRCREEIKKKKTCHTEAYFFGQAAFSSGVYSGWLEHFLPLRWLGKVSQKTWFHPRSPIEWMGPIFRDKMIPKINKDIGNT